MEEGEGDGGWVGGGRARVRTGKGRVAKVLWKKRIKEKRRDN
jgi:hypothetical protein